MEHFWPHLPLIVPGSEGMPLWYDIVGWVFQIVIMTCIIWLVTRWALKMERLTGERANTASSPASKGTKVDS